MGLSIRTTPTKIAIETKLGGLNWQTKQARLELRQKHAKVNIRTEQPMVQIDQYQCFAESGLKNNSDFMKEQAQKGHQSIIGYTGKVSQNGDSMAKIGHKANIMINIAKNQALTKHQFGIGMMPRSRPRVSVRGGTVEIQAEQRNNMGEINGVRSIYSSGNISFDYTPTKVDIRIESLSSIDISYTGNNLDRYI